jgi:uroporphyrinogen decarboxylase
MNYIKALEGYIFERPPVWLMRQAGRYLPEYRALRAKAADFMALCLTPEWAVEVTLQPMRRFAFDAAIIFSDILMVPYGLGQEVAFLAGEGPKLGALPLHPSYNPDSLLKRLQPVYDAIKGVRGVLSSDKALIGFAGAPWTVLTYMCEGGSSKAFDCTRELYWSKPDYFGVLLKNVIHATIDHLRAQIQAGVNAVQLFDSWAGQVPAFMREAVIYQPTAEIVRVLSAEFPHIPIIGFPRGLSHLLEEYVTQTGVTAVGLDTFTAPEHVSCSCPLQGGLDPALLVVGGDPLRQAVERYLKAFRKLPYIFNLGHGILPQTPIAHVEEILRIIHG